MAVITDQALERMLTDLHGEIGVEYELPQFNHSVCAETIRHFAMGYGDDNPLWCAEDYAKSTPWRGIVAPPAFVLSCGFPRSRGLPGVHGLFSGADIEYRRALRPGDDIRAVTHLEEIEEKNGSYAGREFKQTYVTRYTVRGEEVATLRSYAFRTRRDVANEKGKYRPLTRKTYAQDEIDRIQRHYLDEPRVRRGADRLDMARLSPGDSLPELLKGPLSVSDIISWIAGAGGVYIQSARQWYEFLNRHPGAGVKDEYGVPDAPERVHWDEVLSSRIGMPGPYDYGPQRVAWMGHVVSDWAGDNAWVKRLRVVLRQPNYVGDLSTLTGTVNTIAADGRTCDVAITCTDQRGRVTATGTATVEAYDGQEGTG